MLVRTMLVAVSFCVALATGGVAAAPAKDGFKMTITLDPVPPLTQTPLALNCEFTLEGSIVYIDCHNAEPNPSPPKDTKTAKVSIGPNKFKATAYPSGEVLLTARVKQAFLQ